MKNVKRKNEEISNNSIELIEKTGRRSMTLKEGIILAQAENADLIEVCEKENKSLCKIISKNKETSKKYSFDEINELMPTPFYLIYKTFNETKDPFRKVHYLIDSIEVLTKLHTVIIVSEYFSRENISDDLKGLLAAGLKTPSLGIWWQFAREISKETKKDKSHSYFEDLNRYVLKHLLKQLEGKKNLITFRNSYAHGATPTDAKCIEDINTYSTLFEKLIMNTTHFSNIKIISVNNNGETFEAVGQNLSKIEPIANLELGKTYCKIGDNIISLHPLLTYKEDSDKYFFYNDLRNNDIRIINYDNCMHEKDVDLKTELLSLYQIDKWGKTKSAEKFKSRIESLTETFKGRQKELNDIISFIFNRKEKFLFYWGNPGIGKSALLARAIQILKWPKDFQIQSGIFPIDTNINNIDVIEYFFRRGADTENAGGMLEYINLLLEEKYKLGLKTTGNIKEQQKGFFDRLQLVSEKLNKNEMLLLFFDGLDERSDDLELLESLPKICDKNIKIIYASRDISVIRERVYEKLETGDCLNMTISGLSEEDTRSFLYDYVNKYNINNEYVKAIVQKSEGNPLYIKLLCDGLENGDYSLNDIDILPVAIGDMYEKILKRLSHINNANDFLRLLAAGKDYFTPSMIKSVMQIDIDIAKNLVANTMELLIKTDSESYQLFHESLREYLLEKYNEEVFDWEMRITQWCRENWNKEILGKDNSSQLYAVKQIIVHIIKLYDNYNNNEIKEKLLNEVLELIQNDSFIKMLFLFAGNEILFQQNLTQIQERLLNSDSVILSNKLFIKLLKMYNEVPDTLYKQQFNELLSSAKKQDWNKVALIAEIGSSYEEKLMLAMHAIRESNIVVDDNFKVLNEKATEWIKKSDDDTIKNLWNITVNKKGE